jgi:type II secretory pathway pseudopilin PulG
MCAIALMGVAMTVVGKQWSVEMKRDREAELAFRGERIKTAIEAYAADYEVMKATRPNRYPVNLQQLTQKPKRYLPRVYKDPITDQDFELIKVGAEIRGVRSRSKGVPLDQVRFKKAATYREILFQAMPPSGGQACGPGAVAINPLNPLAGCIPAGQAATPAGPESQSGSQPAQPAP